MSAELTFSAHRGDGAALLAFDVPDELAPTLAGFAVECKPPNGTSYPLLNRLSFEQQITSETKPEDREWTPTDKAPVQKFHWIHYPKDVPPGTFTYKATAMKFVDGSETDVEPGPTAKVSLELRDEGYGKLEVGFTRGDLSSQAYAELFDNADYQPAPPTAVFDTSQYEDQYRWLGSHARKLVFEVIDETVADPTLSLDVFAYDFDEPNVIRKLASLGSRLRLFLDDSDLGETGGQAARKAEALKVIEALPRTSVKRGDFRKLAHDKILIQKRDGKPVKVLSGSANFSVRGLYVQANNVFVFDDPDTAKIYEDAFEQAWEDEKGFPASPIAADWFPDPPKTGSDLPDFRVSFAPHGDPDLFLQRVADAIHEAKSSVLFAIMEIGTGSGPVLKEIKALPKRPEIYAFGTTQSLDDGSLKVHPPGGEPIFIPFSYLRDKVPEPFRKETAGGGGKVIHHKFVVVDFNGSDPKVFAGSSNLAKGGESENGDNLLMFSDAAIASTYAVEAIRLIDHYRFRAAMKEATDAKPLTLKQRSENWAADYFVPGTAKYRERKLFAS
jgi:hypothetical protein